MARYGGGDGVVDGDGELVVRAVRVRAAAHVGAEARTVEPVRPRAVRPSATVTVSPWSFQESYLAVSTSVAVCAAAPEKPQLRGRRRPAVSVTPVLRDPPDFSARLQSAVEAVPPTASGTSTISPATSARPSVTVNSAVLPSSTAPLPTRCERDDGRIVVGDD